MTIGFEQAFADTEKAAAATVKSAGAVARQARNLEKAAKTGNINAIKRAQAELDSALGALRQEIANAGQSWPFQPDDEEVYLRESFGEELRQEAALRGLAIHERDDRLIAHPSILRVLPGSRAVRIDGKQTSTIRPSHLAALLLANQQKPPRFNNRAFLDSLHSAYRTLLGNRARQSNMASGAAEAVPVSNIYETFTLMPGSARDYSRTDFARDLYRLDTEGPKEIRGMHLNFHGGRQSNISFIAADGHLLTYHNISFSEVGNG